jgi:hypothetical protein
MEDDALKLVCLDEEMVNQSKIRCVSLTDSYFSLCIFNTMRFPIPTIMLV